MSPRCTQNQSEEPKHEKNTLSLASSCTFDVYIRLQLLRRKQTLEVCSRCRPVRTSRVTVQLESWRLAPPPLANNVNGWGQSP